MTSLYITSTKNASGKTAVTLAIGLHLKANGYQVGYLKPISVEPISIGDKAADEDAIFAKDALKLEADPWELSPVMLTVDSLQDYLAAPDEQDMMGRVKSACKAAQTGKDLLLLEGGGGLREGYTVGLPVHQVAKTVGSRILTIVRFVNEIQLLDDAIASQALLGDAFCGIIINRFLPECRTFISKTGAPYLEKKGIPVFGVMPETQGLSAMTVGEIVALLKAEVLTKYYRPSALVENLTVGAMTAETALSRFRQFSRKAVITGGDRTDLQLAALETSTTCLILTGGLRPSPLVVKQAEEFGVSVVLTPKNTLEAVESIERIYGRTRLSHIAKLRQFQELMDKYFDYDRLYRAIGLK